jgi:hypothetical protein
MRNHELNHHLPDLISAEMTDMSFEVCVLCYAFYQRKPADIVASRMHGQESARTYSPIFRNRSGPLRSATKRSVADVGFCPQ